MPKAESGFKGVAIKTDLHEDIHKFIEEHPEAGYKSVADFVQEATRLRIQKLRETYPSPEENVSE